MKATPPVRPQDVSTHRLAPRSLHISRCRRLQEQEQEEDHLARCRRMREQEEQEDHHLARCRRMQEQQQEQQEREEEEEALRRGDMNDCYSRLKRLVPTIPQDKKVSKVEILQHVIDYILDLQLALETHPALSKQTPQTQTPQTPQTLRTPGPPNPSRTPLTVLNTDHQRTSIVKKPEDSILCR